MVALPEQQHRIFEADRVTTMRVYIAAAAKRAAIVKGDDLLAKSDTQANPDKVSKAPYTELKTWFGNKCFNIQDVSKASSIMTSRYVYTWKSAKNEMGEMERAIRVRLALRGSMGLEAFGAEAFSGAALRLSQKLLASAAAREKQWATVSFDVNMAFLKGLADQELAEATGEEKNV
eukprot:2214756-Pyramimonas_sp.AAC.1